MEFNELSIFYPKKYFNSLFYLIHFFFRFSSTMGSLFKLSKTFFFFLQYLIFLNIIFKEINTFIQQ